MMAGKRQHYIPQFLQRGFASHSVRNEVFTWVYRKGRNPFNTNIKNVGVESLFYSEHEDKKLDDSITLFEGEYCSLLADLHTGKSIQSLNPENIAQLLAHLELRTRHIRQSFLNSGMQVVDEVLKFVGDTEAFGSYLQRKFRRDPSLMQNAMSEELRKRGISQQKLPHIMRIFGPLIEQSIPYLLPKLQLPDMLDYFRDMVPSKLQNAMKSGHIKALNQSLAPEFKVNLLKNLKYSVVDFKEGALPLGDSVVLFHVEGERGFKPLIEKGDQLRAVILPISPHGVLVGATTNYQPDMLKLHREIIGCSLEYFIASEDSETNAIMSKAIGVNAYLVSQQQIEEIIDKIINK